MSLPQAVNQLDWGPVEVAAELLRVKIDRSVNFDRARWDGRVIRTDYPVDALHDLAHFQVAPAWRRRRVGFGLGLEPTGGGVYAPMLASSDRAIAEEELASMLGLIWACELGYEWRNEAMEHSWCVEGVEHPAALSLGHSDKLDAIGVTKDGGINWPPRCARPWRSSDFWQAG